MTLRKFLQKPRKPKAPLFLLRRVMGDSMLPTLKQGRLVLGFRPRKLAAGDVVVVRHDNVDKIKRVREIQNNAVFLIGDNFLHSTDSREFGWLDVSLVIAKIAWPRNHG